MNNTYNFQNLIHNSSFDPLFLPNGPVNGLGNLIVGYDEPRLSGSDKTGSHNIVVGFRHNYSSYGGLVVGEYNEIAGGYATVSGGYNYTTNSNYTSVSGGEKSSCGPSL